MTNICLKRLQKELVAIQKNPIQNISTCPNDSNLLEWHYVIEGPADSVYAGGYYHGMLRFPTEYPYKPPSIFMITKSGRFRTNFRLCLSMSDYHPETWNPMWSVASILQGLLSFMLDSQSTLGSVEASEETRRVLAKESLSENCKNQVFRKLFPHYIAVHREQQQLLHAVPLVRAKEPAALEPVKENNQNNNNPRLALFLLACVGAMLSVAAAGVHFNNN
jgi:ubiquitin-conjugating enzyme E2 J2